jgi:hypothetical protein
VQFQKLTKTGAKTGPKKPFLPLFLKKYKKIVPNR